MQIHAVPSFDRHVPALARIVAEAGLLPHPAVVAAARGAIFPTIHGLRSRGKAIIRDGMQVGLHDDGTTPVWALFWSHDLSAEQPKGWRVAHVWPHRNDLECYTHLANLFLTPDCLAGLTLECGPITSYLRWHSWSKYGWRPAHVPVPTKPNDYDTVSWNYLDAPAGEPLALVRKRLLASESMRARTLLAIMKS